MSIRKQLLKFPAKCSICNKKQGLGEFLHLICRSCLVRSKQKTQSGTQNFVLPSEIADCLNSIVGGIENSIAELTSLITVLKYPNIFGVSKKGLTKDKQLNKPSSRTTAPRVQLVPLPKPVPITGLKFYKTPKDLKRKS